VNRDSTSVAASVTRIRERIERAASRAGRRAEDITLVGISKTHAAAQIRGAYDAGVRHFGENRVQEWESKKASLADLDATWHMVGHLQGNKAARAVHLFHSIDSVDSIALAERLDRAIEDLSAEGTEKAGASHAGGAGRLRALIEVKLDSGSAKSGVSSDELPRLIEALSRLPHLDLRGLMGVPPYFEDPGKARPYFQRLRELRATLRAQQGWELLPVLSMGMSHDFEIAIEEGATEIRVGTALFGARPKA
jgi:pyridoxal phosphate enzyme (YggS family)